MSRSTGQRERFATPEGREHQRRMSEAAAKVKRENRAIPPHLEVLNSKLRREGIKAAERLAIIRTVQQEQQA